MTAGNKIPIGILGATGMVGQRLITMLHNHPWFEICVLAASSNSAGKTYEQATSKRWHFDIPIPVFVAKMNVYSIEKDIDEVSKKVDLVFSAFNADKEFTKNIEIEYASREIVVISNNSAHRWTSDVPLLIPEINKKHLSILEFQKRRFNWKRGCIVVKPNCSIQSFVPILFAWKEFSPKSVVVSTYQAVSGAGKTLDSWPEMQDNVIPFISGEEEKSENEPLKVLGKLVNDKIEFAKDLNISAHCIRVPVSDGHLASIRLNFGVKVSKQELIEALGNVKPCVGLPSAPDIFIKYKEQIDRPQTAVDRYFEKGMGITVGRIQPDKVFDWKCIGLSHNTVRGAAGGSVLNAELLVEQGYLR